MAFSESFRSSYTYPRLEWTRASADLEEGAVRSEREVVSHIIPINKWYTLSVWLGGNERRKLGTGI